MPASRFLKIMQETGQIPVCSFYLPVSTSRNHPVVCVHGQTGVVKKVTENSEDPFLGSTSSHSPIVSMKSVFWSFSLPGPVAGPLLHGVMCTNLQTRICKLTLQNLLVASGQHVSDPVNSWKDQNLNVLQEKHLCSNLPGICKCLWPWLLSNSGSNITVRKP